MDRAQRVVGLKRDETCKLQRMLGATSLGVSDQRPHNTFMAHPRLAGARTFCSDDPIPFYLELGQLLQEAFMIYLSSSLLNM